MNYRLILATGMAAMMAGTPMAFGTMSDEQALEQELNAQMPAEPTRSTVKTPPSVTQALKALSTLQDNSAAAPAACNETKFVYFAGKYALSSDSATGKSCRIYDLSFPTLKTFFARNSVSKIPVERFTAKDYLNWIKGRHDQVYQRVIDIRSNFKPHEAAQASWVGQLKFKAGTKAQAQIQAAGQAILPKSFHASDLDIGTFRFAENEKRQLHELLGQAQALTQSGLMPMGGIDPAWSQAIEKPETFLQKVRFDWNDAEKVYEVMLEGEFVPMNGPIALVDFNAQYKFAVESILRGALGQALRTLTYVIPNIAARNLIYVAVNDTFEFLDMLYASQLAQLEDTLRAGLANKIQIEAEGPQLQSGLNILFGSGSALFSEYIMSMAQGQTFDWQQMDKLGKLARYREEKVRNATLANLNSKMVLTQGCDVERINTYFAICSKKGQKQAIYSLMSDVKILFWNPGAPLVHRYSMPSEVLLKRSTAWLLSAAIRMFDVPYLPGRLSRGLGYLVQDYAQSGMQDEAYLKNYLWLAKKTNGSLDPEQEKLLKWLYFQNINPFVPKSEGLEDAVIKKNTSLLNARSSGASSLSPIQGVLQ